MRDCTHCGVTSAVCESAQDEAEKAVRANWKAEIEKPTAAVARARHRAECCSNCQHI